MTRLYKRDYRVRVDTLELRGFDIAFEVEKSAKREPNTCALRIWNMTEDHRKQIEQLSVNRKSGPGKIRVEIEAGYVDGQTSLIFRGDLRTARTEREGPDLITKIEGEDGGRSVLRARVNRSFPPGTKVEDVVKACARAMGVGTGNLDELTRGTRLSGEGATFSAGTVLSGPAADELAGVLRSVGLRYSVQDGVLQILRRGRPLQATATVLAAGTGLIGTPAANPDGTVTASCLLIPNVYPGRKVRFDTNAIKGDYRIERAKYVGDTFANDWTIGLECKPIGEAA